MNIRTIEQEFEHRLSNIITSVLRNHEMTKADFSTGEELFDFLWEHSENFAHAVIDDMSQWMGEDEWLDKVK